MGFKLTGIKAVITLLLLIGLFAAFSMGKFYTPDRENILQKTGTQITNLIKSDVMAGQSALINNLDSNNKTQTAAIIAQEVKALEKIKVGNIKIRPYHTMAFSVSRLFERQSKFIMQVEYTIGERNTIRSITLELNTSMLGAWTVMPSPMPF